MNAQQRVTRALAAASRLADPRDPMGREARERLPGASGLSVGGVELALSEHLERYATPGEMRALLAWATPAPRCHVVLSANVCTAAVRALALAVATSADVVVKPSRRDPVVAELVVRAVKSDPAFRDAEGAIRPAEEVEPAAGDELHVYGRDSTIEELRARWPAARLRAHGNGFGIAVVGASAAIDEAADALARDVVPFDQRGCLSPRIALVEGDARRARAFADALHASLARIEGAVPRGRVEDADAAALVRYVETAAAVGDVHRGAAHVVGLDPSPRALVLPPAVRAVHVAPITHASVTSLLAPLARHVAAIGTDGTTADLREALRRLVGRARRSGLGRMQKPPLDGPVDRR